MLEADQQIVSIVRLGIETARLVSIGGTYTFPAYRRKVLLNASYNLQLTRLLQRDELPT